MVSMYSTTYVDDIREIKEENPFESMMSRFDRAAQLLDLDPDLYAVLRVPNRELKVYIPTRMDSGRIQVFEGYRVQHNFARGPAKGGIREPHWHPNASELSYCIKGQAAMTIFSPGNNHDTFTIKPGEMTYVPRGYIHDIQNVGDEEAKFVLAFNNELPQDLGISG